MRRWLREPLLHFLLLGAAIFGAFGLFGPDDARQSVIVVSQGEIEGQIEAFRRTWLRLPTQAELDGLIREHVRDEIYYREGLALGLDRDDTVIRRRLRQKLEFVAEAAGMAAEPADDELRAWLAAHPERYRTDPRVSFAQVYLSPDRRGATLARDSERLLADLRASGGSIEPATLGDPTLLDHVVVDVPLREVAARFGEAFAERIAGLPVGGWQGPVESSYGTHLVYLRERIDGRVPPLEEAYDAIRRDWLEDRRVAANEAFYRSLLKRYDVIVARTPVTTHAAAGAAAR